MEAFVNLFKSKAVGFAVLFAFIIGTGLVDLKMALDPHSRPDANTGEDGRRRDSELLQLRADLDALTADVMAWEVQCNERYNKVNVILENHSVNIKHNKEELHECLKRIQ